MSFSAHVHHVQADRWYRDLADEQELIFCRLTQLGLLRLLTNASVMGNRVKTQRQAWAILDTLFDEGNARLMQEPRSLDESFRRLSNSALTATKDWADSYLAAFAEAADVIFVTFDKALAARVQGAVLLSEG